MKLLFLLFIAIIVSTTVYFISLKLSKKGKKYSRRPFYLAATIFMVLLGLIAYGIYISDHQPDTQCTSPHVINYQPPSNLKTAKDYFDLGNYHYDQGNCQQAFMDYSKAIELNPNYAQAYNNRAYTNMRMRNYNVALADLNTAIQLNPNYVQALMNRGDIHNYYYQIDRQAAIADYEKVIALEGPDGGNGSVCGHLYLAKHNGWNFGTFLDLLDGKFRTCD